LRPTRIRDKKMKKTFILVAVIGSRIMANAQTTNNTGGVGWLQVIFWILILLFILLYYYFRKKLKEEQIQMGEVFQSRGFSNTDLILTKGSFSPTGKISSQLVLDKATFNIAIGVKDGVLSFFGGEYRGKLVVKDAAVAIENKFFNYLFSVYNNIIGSVIFRIKYERKIRHLFDIHINDIVEIEPQEANYGAVILNIYDQSDKRTILCFHYSLNSLNNNLANIMIRVFEKILDSGSISSAKISQINEEIENACKKASDEIKKKTLKGVALVGGIIVGAAAVAASRAGKDLGNYSKSSGRYMNPDTGIIVDEDGNRLPW